MAPRMLPFAVAQVIEHRNLLERLRSNHLPRPSTWRHLLNLWSYIAPEVTSWQCHDADCLRIVPVQGKEVLYAASEIVRLGEKKLLQSEDDWEFLAGHLIVLNQNWTRFLADARRERDEDESGSKETADGALAVLKKVGLAESSDVST